MKAILFFGSALVRNATPVTIDGDVNEDGTFNLR